jgi:hypothetical protein
MAAGMQFKGYWQVAANTPSLITAMASNQDGFMWVAKTANPLIPETVPTGVTGIAGQKVANGDYVVWDAAGAAYHAIAAALVAGLSASRYEICMIPVPTQLEWGWQVSTTP